MKIIQENGFNKLIAEENMQLRNANDSYIKASEEQEEHIPYYFKYAYLPLSIDLEKAKELYVEEPIDK